MGDGTKVSIEACWDISLDAECPKCDELVNLLDYCDFWDGRHLGIGEHDTERSKGVEVICPKCMHEFQVDCIY